MPESFKGAVGGEVLGDINGLTICPQVLQIVIGAGVGHEYVHDDVGIIQQHPVLGVVALQHGGLRLPIDRRLIPQFSAASSHAWVSVPGFASDVNSTPGARGKCAATPSNRRVSSSGGRIDGVPPPKYAVSIAPCGIFAACDAASVSTAST